MTLRSSSFDGSGQSTCQVPGRGPGGLGGPGPCLPGSRLGRGHAARSASWVQDTLQREASGEKHRFSLTPQQLCPGQASSLVTFPLLVAAGATWGPRGGMPSSVHCGRYLWEAPIWESPCLWGLGSIPGVGKVGLGNGGNWTGGPTPLSAAS